MTEVSFAKSFLATLQNKPTKITADHVEDPKGYPARTPYILPRMPKPMTKDAAPLAPGQERSVSVAVKSLRNPPLDIKLPSQPRGTSVLDIKTAVAAQAHVPVAKLRLLHNKKPVLDSKTLRDLLADDGAAAVEFSVMVLGGAATVQADDAAAKAATTTAQGISGAEVLKTEEFWSDLRGFLLQRIRDEEQADALYASFRQTWQAQQ